MYKQFDVGDWLDRYTKDKHNLEILLCDRKLGKELVQTPDCSDLVDFVRIRDVQAVQEDAYIEGVRRYFVHAEKLMLVPSWTCEFLNLVCSSVTNNIAKFGLEGGLDALFRRFPGAYAFVSLWNSGKYEEAGKLFAEDSTWKQIVGFTQQQHLEEVLGNPIRRFNGLVESGKLVGVQEFIGSSELKMDGPVFTKLLDSLRSLRSEIKDPRNVGKNEADAQSVAVVRWVNRQVAGKTFTAVTRSALPLKAFYASLGNLSPEDDVPVSLARSALSGWLGEIAAHVAPGDTEGYLERGIHLLSQMIEHLVDGPGAFDEHHSSAIVLTEEDIGHAVHSGAYFSLRNLYRDHYFHPLFRIVAHHGTKPRAPLELTAEAGVAALTKTRFEDGMRQAYGSLKEDVRRMVENSRHYVEPGGAHAVAGQKLRELFDELQKGVNTDIF